MSIKKAYDDWSKIYDQNKNRTRDLDKIATIETLSRYEFKKVLELGCGTGKNTTWLCSQATNILAVDFSENMLLFAKEKVKDEKVTFKTADINKNWSFTSEQFDLITSCLVLEHVENLDFIFKSALQALHSNGLFFICELHPFKQYNGTKARFETENGVQELDVFMHHITDFTEVAKVNNFELLEIKEWFDDDKKDTIPRLISFVFCKK